jgi:hypothetical protein
MLSELRTGVRAVVRSLVPTVVRTVVLPFLRAGVPAVALIEEMIIQPRLLSRRLAMNCQWPLQY